jgi:cytochrome P450
MSVEFDPFSSTYFDDPSETYRRLRDEAPVYFSERYGFYALSRYDDVAAAHKDWRSFTSTHGVDLSMLTTRDPADVAALHSIIMMDPPEHDRLRALVSRVFTPRAIQGLEPMVREVIAGFCEQIGDASEFDAVQDLTGPFPVEVISVMLGVPPAERQQVRHWLDEMLTREPGEVHPTEAGSQAAVAMGTYMYELAVAKRADPGDDLLSQLTQVTVEREDGSETGLDDVEVAGFATLLGGAGAETVTKLVANAFVLFHQNPDQWAAVLADPALIPAAVDETLRILPPSQYQGRFCVQDVELHGTTIGAGHPVLLVTGAATRDERFFDDPDVFRLDRPPSQSLGFGLGIHSCLGAALARLESRIAIEEIVQRWPRFEVDEEGLRRVAMSNVAGYSNVPVRVLEPAVRS